ncbi:MAG: hypothetical protein KDA44_04510 [Planctomycetales bacterium]|nr:hypothetical protein [Planctomycetales bacterium]
MNAVHQSRQGDFSIVPLLEARVGVRRSITPSVTLGVQWSAFHLPNMQSASEAVVYELPAMGLQSTSRDISQHTLMFTLEHRR